MDRRVHIPPLPVQRRSTGEHQVHLGEQTRLAHAQFGRRRAKAGQIVHRVIDREAGANGRGLGAEGHRRVVPENGAVPGRTNGSTKRADLPIHVVPEPVLSRQSWAASGVTTVTP